MIPYVAPQRIRNAEATKQAILEAARKRFADEGYDRASLRDIASDVGVDAALVSRYFGAKEELFKEVLCRGPHPNDLFDGDRADFGKRMARMLVVDPLDPDKIDKFLIMLRSASSPKAAETMRQNGQETFYGPFEEWIGGDDPEVRVRLAAGAIMGFAICRAIDDSYGLDEEGRKKLCSRLADLLQKTVEDGSENR